MRDAPRTGPPEPTTSDKIHFWMGGSLPNTFGAWAREQIRSRWFPLRRMVPTVATAMLCVALASGSSKSLTYLLLVTSLPLTIALVGVFVFQDRMRRRELRRYGIPGSTGTSDVDDDEQTSRLKGRTG